MSKKCFNLIFILFILISTCTVHVNAKDIGSFFSTTIGKATALIAGSFALGILYWYWHKAEQPSDPMRIAFNNLFNLRRPDAIIDQYASDPKKTESYFNALTFSEKNTFKALMNLYYQNPHNKYGQTLHKRGSVASMLINLCKENQIDYPIDYFDIMKLCVKNSPYHVEDWETYRVTSENLHYTHCHASAEYVLRLFTGREDIDRYLTFRAFRKTKVLPIPLLDTEYLGNFENFTKKDQNHIARKLLTNSDKPEHLLFHIDFRLGEHSVVIEKQNDGVKTWWTIYQGWGGYFSLAEWLGVDPWRTFWGNNQTIKDSCTAIYKRFGKGQKIFDQSEIATFIERFWNPDEYNIPLNQDALIYVRMYQQK